jgi:hypothetical protein
MAIDSYGAGLLLVLLTVLLSVGGLLLFRKYLSKETLRESHEVAGYLLAVVGTMYAVLLGLVVVDAMNKFQEARVNVQNEANSLADVFLLSERFPEKNERKIKDLCLQYVNQVINIEWNDMDDGKQCPEAHKTGIALMRAVENCEPKTDGEQEVYQIAVQEVCQVWDYRRARIAACEYNVPPEEWLVLFIGAIVTIVFTYFFALKSTALQIVMTAMVSVLIALNMLLVLWFGYPFSGDRKVHSDAFVIDDNIFHNQLGVHPSDKTES